MLSLTPQDLYLLEALLVYWTNEKTEVPALAKSGRGSSPAQWCRLAGTTVLSHMLPAGSHQTNPDAVSQPAALRSLAWPVCRPHISVLPHFSSPSLMLPLICPGPSSLLGSKTSSPGAPSLVAHRMAGWDRGLWMDTEALRGLCCGPWLVPWSQRDSAPGAEGKDCWVAEWNT